MSPTRDPTSWSGEMFRRLVRFFRKNIRHAESAPDLAQEALAAFGSMDVEKLEKPVSYLMRIAANLAARHRLREIWEQQNLESLSGTDEPATPAALPQSPEPLFFERALQRALSKLDAMSQDVLTLWLSRCTYEEIADAMSLTTSQVHRNLQETFALLRSLLNDAPTERK